MRKLLGTALTAMAMAYATLPTAVQAATQVCINPGCVQPSNNVLFTTNQTGTTVQGTLNGAPDAMVTFIGMESLDTTSSQGQARILASDGGLNFLEIMLGGGQTFSEIEFNLNALADGTATITFLGAGGSTLLTTSALAITASGQNYFGGFGDAFTGVRIETTAALGDVRQVRLGGLSPLAAVPEPSTWAMMLFGFAGVGLAMRRRRRDPAFLQQIA